MFYFVLVSVIGSGIMILLHLTVFVACMFLPAGKDIAKTAVKALLQGIMLGAWFGWGLYLLLQAT